MSSIKKKNLIIHKITREMEGEVECTKVIVIFHRLSTESAVSKNISRITRLLILSSGLTPL